MKTTKANKKVLVILAAMAAISSTAFGAGVNNTVDPNATLYGAEAYGKDNVIAATGTSAFAVGYNNTVAGDNSFVYGNANKATGTNAIAGGEYSKAAGRNSVAIGSSAQALKNDTFAIGSQARANGDNALAFGNGAYAENSNTVAIGRTVKAEADSAVAIGIRTSASGNSTVAIGRDNSVTSADTTVIGSNNGSVAAEQSVVVGYNNTVVGTDPEQVVVGSNSKTGAQGAVAIGTHAEATAMDAMALGNNTLADNANSVALGTNSVTDAVVNTASATIGGKTYNFAGTDALSTVSVGSDTRSSANGAANYKRTITNVAAGRISDTSTDAVNGSQLHAIIEETDKIGTKVNSHETHINDISAKVDKNKEALGNHEVRITDLEDKVTVIGPNAIKEANNYTDSQVASVGAQSAALAGLHPLDFNKDDKASYAASIGHYRNANAVAVGAFYRPNERTMISGAVSFGKHLQMNVGVAFKTGKGSEYINEAKSKDSRIEKLEALVEKLTAEVAELKVNK